MWLKELEKYERKQQRQKARQFQASVYTIYKDVIDGQEVLVKRYPPENADRYNTKLEEWFEQITWEKP